MAAMWRLNLPAMGYLHSGLRRERVREILGYLKGRIDRPYAMLYDLTAIDERMRVNREGLPPSAFTVVYHLFSFERNEYIRMKTALHAGSLSLDSITSLWPAANWYEREVWDMFGISFSGHPHLQRILMPKSWTGHPLRKDHPARATEMGPFHLSEEKEEAEQELLRFRPEEWGMQRSRDGSDFIFLNLGPQHPGTHGVLRIVVQLDGEEIVDAVPEIGFHHRGAEKMGERQILAYLYSIHRPRGLLGRRNEQSRVPYGRGEAGGYHGSTARPGNPRDALRTVSDHQSPGLVRHVRAGPGPAFTGVLYVQRPGARIWHHRSHLRGAHASQLVSYRRSGGGPAGRLGRHVPRFHPLLSAPPGRIRP